MHGFVTGMGKRASTSPRARDARGNNNFFHADNCWRNRHSSLPRALWQHFIEPPRHILLWKTLSPGNRAALNKCPTKQRRSALTSVEDYPGTPLERSIRLIIRASLRTPRQPKSDLTRPTIGIRQRSAGACIYAEIRGPLEVWPARGAGATTWFSRNFWACMAPHQLATIRLLKSIS